jgi:7-carboxy-7-deazaguanine synthase
MLDGTPEIFHTIQGEGRNCGMPAVFIRASLCNLHCVWCDTDYTWNWEGTSFRHDRDADLAYRKHRREEMIITLSEEEIVKIGRAFHCQNFVFTGGEPLLQEKNWCRLMDLLRPEAHCEVETNGTLFPGERFLSRINQLNVSPKLANSGVAASDRSKPEVLKQLVLTGKADFKFVISSEEDFNETQSLIEYCQIPADRVFLMPEAATENELLLNQGRVATLALKHGFRYSDRLHLRLYGAKRGV